MNRIVAFLSQSPVDAAVITVMVIGGLVGFLQQRTLRAAFVTALNASMIVPAALLAASSVIPSAIALIPRQLAGLAGFMLLLFIVGEFAREASNIDRSELKQRSNDRSRPIASRLASIALAIVDVVVYLGWFHRLVEFNSLPTVQQQRIEGVRDHRLAPFLRVIFLFILLVLFVVLTVGALFGYLSQTP